MPDTIDLLQTDLSLTLKKKAYKPIRKAQIERIFDLSELIYEQKRPVIIVFEGWDAAGKGTTIRRLTAPLDARGFKVLSTQAPRTHEKRKPWLWRFWMNVPRHGQIAIYDRSWYGRVLVERVDGLTPLPQWIAAYEEINNFERTLADDGAIFIKFWLHISKDEQLRRFMKLASEPENAWRVTAEDWENHRKYDEYLAAVEDMLDKTNTPIAPWTVAPSTDGEVRLYTVFGTIIRRLEAALGLTPTPWPSLAELSGGKQAKDKLQDKSKKKTKGDKKAKDGKQNESEQVAAAPNVKPKTKKKDKRRSDNDMEVKDKDAQTPPLEIPAPVLAEITLAKPASRRRKATPVATKSDATEPDADTVREVDHA